MQNSFDPRNPQQTDVLCRAKTSLLNHASNIKLAKALIKYSCLKSRIHASFWQDAHKKKIDLSWSLQTAVIKV